MSFYTRSQATALRLLRKYGQFMTLTQNTPGSYDPATGSVSTSASGETVTGAVFDYPAKMIDGTLIRQGDKTVYLAAKGMTLTPAPGMTLTDADANTYTVITAQPLNPAGVAVIHTLQVRTA
jgi:hypothetical protein